MKIKEICEVKKGPGAVNDMLKTGWELINAVGLDSGMVYVLGKREEAPLKEDSRKK